MAVTQPVWGTASSKAAERAMALGCKPALLLCFGWLPPAVLGVALKLLGVVAFSPPMCFITGVEVSLCLAAVH